MITAFSYVGIRSPRAAEWADLGPNVLGMELVRNDADGVVLRHDDAAHRITVCPGDADALDYLGWDVGGPEGLREAVARLQADGYTVAQGEPGLAAARKVAGIAWFTDPFGFRHELSWGLHTLPGTFRPGRAHGGFVTGSGGLGHLVLLVPELEQALHLFVDVLGFRLSDAIDIGMQLRFLHCNGRHHTVALAGTPGMVGVHHLMLEVRSLDDVGTALDLVNAREIPVTMSLGRHTNDLTTSFYLRSPSGFDIEYGWGGVQVEDSTWTVRTFLATSIWGHKPPPGGAPQPGMVKRV